MDIKVNVKLYSRKLNVPIKSIIVPKEFGTPKPEKIIKHCEDYFQDYNGLDPIIVDDNMTLVDGYISLLVLQAKEIKKAKVYKIIPHVKFTKQQEKTTISEVAST